MAEFLSAEQHYLTARLANLMQVFVNQQEEQIHALADHYADLFATERDRFTQLPYEQAIAGLRDIGTDNRLGMGAREAAREEEAMYRDPGYDTYRAHQTEQDITTSEAIEQREHPPWEVYIPTEAEQQAYEDAPYDRLEGLAHGVIEIDTSDPGMGQSWQDQLAQLDAWMETLTREVDAHEQSHQQGQGMGY